jgi:uncharacterized caspase-like protein
MLRKGGVGLFFYAGHGVQVGGRNYLLPLGARITKELDFKFQAVDVEVVLAEMGSAGNPLNIVILDACRDNPYGRNFRSASRGLAIISDAPKGTFISYSTSPGRVAVDGAGRNSPYTESLLRHVNTPGLPIEEVFKNVRKDIVKKTRGQQVPWELSSLEGRFFFHTGSASDAVTTSPSVDYAAEKQRIGAEKERLRQEQELETQQRALEEQKRSQQTEIESRRLAEERAQIDKERKEILKRGKELVDEQRRLAEERGRVEAKQRIDAEAAEAARQAAQTKEETAHLLAIGNRPSVATAKEMSRDGRFIAYKNGTVLDTQTNLMWAAKDNGSDINWSDAKSYCENYHGSGYTDWRMPTQDELAGLYDASKSQPAECTSSYQNHVATELIHLTCSFLWASETRGSVAASYGFGRGLSNWNHQLGVFHNRALPVRSVE